MPQNGAGQPKDLEHKHEFPQIVRVRDVLVVPSPGHRANEQDWRDNPPVEGALDLGNGVFVERLRGDDSDLPDQVMDASTARGLNYQATRQFGQLYSFWREIPREASQTLRGRQRRLEQAREQVVQRIRGIWVEEYGRLDRVCQKALQATLSRLSRPIFPKQSANALNAEPVRPNQVPKSANVEQPTNMHHRTTNQHRRLRNTQPIPPRLSLVHTP